jgi:outer membrane protein assembly factor BamB
MSRRLAALLGLLFVSPALAQKDNSKVVTHPPALSPRDLERLNMVSEWRLTVPLDNQADGIATVQLIDNQVFVQTRSNTLIVLREDTGEEVWRLALPRRYQRVFPVGANREMVTVINGPRLLILDRATGKYRHTLDLPSTVAGGLITDPYQCFIVLDNETVISVGLLPEDMRGGQRVPARPDIPELPSGIKVETRSVGAMETVNNRSPSLSGVESLRDPTRSRGIDAHPSYAISETLRRPYKLDNGNRAPSVAMINNLSTLAEATELNRPDRPVIHWTLRANRRLLSRPVMYGDYLVLTGADNSVFVADKYAERVNLIRHEYIADAPLTAPIGQYGPDLYFAVGDGNVYWMNIESFRNADVPVRHLKRFLSGTAVDRPIITTDDSVYLAGSQSGVTRLDRRTFLPLWNNPDADRVFAVNPNVVYAGDRHGKLMILDKARGLNLSGLDIRGYNFPIFNDRDDRLFLASGSGVLVCLHERTYRRPELLRKREPQPVFADPIRGQEVPKLEEPKKEVPKKEEPKKEEPKKVEPKKEEPKKEDAKKEDEKKE